jgi:hypothetical protein
MIHIHEVSVAEIVGLGGVANFFDVVRLRLGHISIHLFWQSDRAQLAKIAGSIARAAT